MSNKETYIKKMLPWAKKAEQETGVPYQFIVAQWGYETAYGTNRGSKELNNHAGIKYSQYAPAGTVKSGMYASYPSMDTFIKDYKRVMSLSYYKPFTSNLTGSNKQLVERFNTTPWAETKYDVNSMVNSMNLALELGEGVKIPQGSTSSPGSNVNVNVNVDDLKNMNLNGAELQDWAKVGLALGIALTLIPKRN